jgi:GAF domain-containing protein
MKNNQLIGVLDIDSYTFARFDKVDQTYLEKFVQSIVKYLT